MRGFRSAVADRISIHAAREGGDGAPPTILWEGLFQSTPPVKAATRCSAGYHSGNCYFNPRRP